LGGTAVPPLLDVRVLMRHREVEVEAGRVVVEE